VLWKKRGGKRRGAGRPPKGHVPDRRTRSGRISTRGIPFTSRCVPSVRSAACAGGASTMRSAKPRSRPRYARTSASSTSASSARTSICSWRPMTRPRWRRDAGLPDLGRQAPQCGDQQGQAGSAPARQGVPDRYHAEIITSPRQARHALSYVMINRPIVRGLRCMRRRGFQEQHVMRSRSTRFSKERKARPAGSCLRSQRERSSRICPISSTDVAVGVDAGSRYFSRAEPAPCHTHC